MMQQGSSSTARFPGAAASQASQAPSGVYTQPQHGALRSVPAAAAPMLTSRSCRSAPQASAVPSGIATIQSIAAAAAAAAPCPCPCQGLQRPTEGLSRDKLSATWTTGALDRTWQSVQPDVAVSGTPFSQAAMQATIPAATMTSWKSRTPPFASASTCAPTPSTSQESTAASDQHCSASSQASLEDRRTWAMLQTIKVGTDQDKEKLAGKVKIFDRSQHQSVKQAVDQLNKGTLQCPDGLCVVYSASSGANYLLYRADQQEAATILAEQLPKSSGREAPSGAAQATSLQAPSFVAGAPSLPPASASTKPEQSSPMAAKTAAVAAAVATATAAVAAVVQERAGTAEPEPSPASHSTPARVPGGGAASSGSAYRSPSPGSRSAASMGLRSGTGGGSPLNASGSPAKGQVSRNSQPVSRTQQFLPQRSAQHRVHSYSPPPLHQQAQQPGSQQKPSQGSLGRSRSKVESDLLAATSAASQTGPGGSRASASSGSGLAAGRSSSTATNLPGASSNLSLASASNGSSRSAAPASPRARASATAAADQQPVNRTPSKGQGGSSSSSRPAGASGRDVEIGGRRYLLGEVIGRGAFGVVWRAHEIGSSASGPDLAVKVVTAKDSGGLAAATFEAELLQILTAGSRHSAKHFPMYHSHSVMRNAAVNSHGVVRLAMSFVPGGPLDKWLYGISDEEHKTVDVAQLVDGQLPGGQQGSWRLTSACAAVREQLLQLAGVFASLQPIAFHRDVSSHNVLVNFKDGDRERPEFALIDFGLAVRSGSWNCDWRNSNLAGDPRYWTPSAWMAFAFGFKYVATHPNPGYQQQYLSRIDHFSLGILGLETLFALWNTGEAYEGKNPGFLEIRAAWVKYWIAVIHLFQMFHTQGAQEVRQFLSQSQDEGVSSLVAHLRQLRQSLRVAAVHHLNSQCAALLLVLADLIDEKGTVRWLEIPNMLHEDLRAQGGSMQNSKLQSAGVDEPARPSSALIESPSPSRRPSHSRIRSMFDHDGRKLVESEVVTSPLLHKSSFQDVCSAQLSPVHSAMAKTDLLSRSFSHRRRTSGYV